MSSNKVQILFAEGRKIFSRLIKAVTWSRFSHVGMIDETGEYVYEAEAFMGVVKTPINEFVERYNGRVVREDYNCDNPKNAFAFMESQLGKSYDYSAIFGILFKTDIDKENAWFCSELVVRSIEEGGTSYFRPDYESRITPEDLWKVNPSIR